MTEPLHQQEIDYLAGRLKVHPSDIVAIRDAGFLIDVELGNYEQYCSGGVNMSQSTINICVERHQPGFTRTPNPGKIAVTREVLALVRLMRQAHQQ